DRRSALSHSYCWLFGLANSPFSPCSWLYSADSLHFFSWSRALGECHLCCPKRNEASTNSCETYPRLAADPLRCRLRARPPLPRGRYRGESLAQAPYPLAPGPRTAAISPNPPPQEPLPRLTGVGSAFTNGHRLSSAPLARG